jgi:hypothetical protein
VIGRYRVQRELGRGRLGPLVLARQRASGSLVALRVAKPEWAGPPVFVARLTRDAFAAALVRHPNLVRLLGAGEAQGRVHFASEYVDGPSLAERVKRQGVLSPREAVALVLQAARGLRAVHGQGLTHGGVPPASVLVDRDGAVKVADLGLVKTPATVDADRRREATGPIPLGDRPQVQAEAFAAAVRADVRGLGWTLDHLVTGLPSGSDADADPQALTARGLPMNLIEVVRGMVAPGPAGGFADLGQAIPALERFLDDRKAGPATTPRDEHTQILDECLRAFRASPSARLKRQLVLGSAGAGALVVLLALVAWIPLLALSFLGLGLMTALASFVIGGITRRDELFADVREFALESRGVDLLVGAAGVVVFVAALVVLRLHWAWLALGLLAVLMAWALHFLVDRKADDERRGAVEEAKALVKTLRLQGVSEEALRGFVRASAGPDWEEFYETLFGPDARRAARGPSERGWRGLLDLRNRHGLMRDGLAAWVGARLEARRLDRARPLLQAVEERGLVAEGVNLVTARRRAWRVADAMLAVASDAAGSDHPALPGDVLKAAEAPETVLVEHETGLIGPERSWVVDLLLGPRTRFLLGAALLAGFLVWVHQNEVVRADQLKEAAARAMEESDPLRAIQNARVDVRLPDQPTPLRLPFLPRAMSILFQGINPGAAGLILVLSALFGVGGRVAGACALGGAAVAMLGPALGLPRLGPLDPSTASIALGAGVALLGAVQDGRR